MINTLKRLWPINRCPHPRPIGIYGDEINHCGGYRLKCANCKRYLNGPTSLATHGQDTFGIYEIKEEPK